MAVPDLRVFNLSKPGQDRVNSHIELQCSSCSCLLKRQKKGWRKICCCPLKPPLSITQSTVTSLCCSTRTIISASLQKAYANLSKQCTKKEKVIIFCLQCCILYPFFLALDLFFSWKWKLTFCEQGTEGFCFQVTCFFMYTLGKQIKRFPNVYVCKYVWPIWVGGSEWK